MTTKDDYVPNQPIWFTEDGSAEWKAGYIESRDPQPDSYWIVNCENNRRIRRNKHDLKPRVPREVRQEEHDSALTFISHPGPVNMTHSEPAPTEQVDHTPEPLSTQSEPPGPVSQPPSPVRPQGKSPLSTVTPSTPGTTGTKTRSGRVSKPKRDTEYEYS